MSTARSATTAQTPASQGARTRAEPAEALGRSAHGRGLDGSAGAVAGMRRLQHDAGNQAVGRAVRERLLVGIPGGSAEREAEAVAQRPPDQRTRGPVGPTVVRDVPPSVLEAIAGGGQALDAGMRAAMEARAGTDLGGVRIHSDAPAAASARELGAGAYTVGLDVVFGPGRYRPDTETGRRLLVHELVHVAQQARGADAGPVLQMAPEAAAPEASSGAEAGAMQRRFEAQILAPLLQQVGIPPIGTRIAVEASHGMVDELTARFSGVAGEALLAQMLLAAARGGPELGKGFSLGLVEGVVSPVTDLFGLVLLGERIQNFALQALTSPLSTRAGLGADLDALIVEARKLGAAGAEAVSAFFEDKKEAVLFLLRLPETLTEAAAKQAYAQGRSGGSQIAESILNPEAKAEDKPQEAPKGVFAWAAQKIEGLEHRFLDTKVSRIGNRIGYAIGWVAIQVLLLAFTTGIGNAIEQAAVGLGKLANLLGQISERVGAVVKGAAKIAEEFGGAIRVVEEALGAVFGKLGKFKALQKVFKPLGEAFEAVQTQLRKVLTKVFGFAETGTGELFETAARQLAAAKATPAVGSAAKAPEPAAPSAAAKPPEPAAPAAAAKPPEPAPPAAAPSPAKAPEPAAPGVVAKPPEPAPPTAAPPPAKAPEPAVLEPPAVAPGAPEPSSTPAPSTAPVPAAEPAPPTAAGGPPGSAAGDRALWAEYDEARKAVKGPPGPEYDAAVARVRKLEDEIRAKGAAAPPPVGAAPAASEANFADVAPSGGPSAPDYRSGRTPLREGDIDRYGAFNTKARRFDVYEGHEVLQNAFLKARGDVLRRGKGAISRGNPSLSVTEDVHVRISRAQGDLGLNDPSVLKGMTDAQVIDANVRALEIAGVEHSQIQMIKREALAHAERVRTGALK